MPLRDVVPVTPASEISRAHFIAIGGAGMNGIAHLFAQRGIAVSGSDQVDSSVLRQLNEVGVTTYVGHRAEQVGEADVVVVSSAVRDDNVELVEARRRGIPIWHRSVALAALMAGHRTVAIAGTAGKTTTSAMAAVMLEAAGADPCYVIGAPLASTGVSAHLSAHHRDGGVMVVEADESDGSFLQYPTEIAVVTNIEADHLDNWGTPQAYLEGFWSFVTQPGVRAVVASEDDPAAGELADRLRDRGATVLTYGESPSADVRLKDLSFEGTTAAATLLYQGREERLELQVPGRYNLHNAAAAYAVGMHLGLDHALLLKGAAAFTGTLRRFQLVDTVAGVRIFDDYAHHPTKLRASLTAARRVGQGRVVACFQPHLYSRTRDFAAEFGEVLTLADVVVVTDVYGAREDPIEGVTGQLIADAATAAGAAEVHYVADKAQLATALAELVRPGDLVMTIGAGDVTLVGALLADALRAREADGE